MEQDLATLNIPNKAEATLHATGVNGPLHDGIS
jgi:hypothetical protein